MGAEAAARFTSIMVAAYTVKSTVLQVREVASGGVCLRRGVSVPTAWVAFGASALMREGLRIGTWLRRSPAAWSPSANGIRVHVPQMQDDAYINGPAGQPLTARRMKLTPAALERRISALEQAVDTLRRDIQGTELPVPAEDLEDSIDTLRRAGFAVWQVGDRWNVGNATLAPAAMVAMARRVAARSGSRGDRS